MTRPRVLVTHPILDPGPQLLAAEVEVVTGTEPSIRARAEGCAGIVSQVMDPIGEEVLSLPGLKIVANCAVGFDNIDLAAATRHGVLATNTPGVLNDTTADFAFALLMAAARRVAEGDRFVREGRYHGWAIDMLLGQDLHGATLGIVGIGRIGRALARRALGFDMRVLYTDDAAPLSPAEEAELGVERRPLVELLRESDYVSLHVPLTPETRHLISHDELQLMKPTAILVNTSRGPVVDEAALAAALKAGEIFAAGIDVYEHEPAVDPGLLGLDNVVLAPHIASGSVRTRSRMSELAALNLLAGLRGERPPNLLNPEAWQT
ncbi:MAG TPA: D-glycerate dehydrogenase [Candidatus Dormibacteraeota bacterium]